MSEDSSRWDTISLRDLFAAGPWPIVLAGWVGGIVACGLWISMPALRIPVVTFWPLAALATAGIAWMLSALAAARFYAYPLRRAWRLYAGIAIAGGTVGALCSMSLFQPRLVELVLCAPPFAVESSKGRIAAWTLPILALVTWLPYVMLRIPPLRRIQHQMAGIGEGDVRYGLAMISFVPVRIVSGALVVAILLPIAYRYGYLDRTAPAKRQLAALGASPTLSAVVSASPDSPFIGMDALRVAQEQRAERLLAALQWDEARPAVHAAACELVTPAAKVEERVQRADDAFRVLEAEITASGRWRPSAEAARAILHLLDVRRRPNGVFFPLVVGEQDSGSEIDPVSLRSSTFPIVFHGEPVMEVRTTVGRTRTGTPVVLQVALKLAGRAAADNAVFAVLEESLGKETIGPTRIGAGAICAVWSTANGAIRLGPDLGPETRDEELNLTSLLWLSWSDPRLPAVRPVRSASGWNAYGCSAVTN
jgi:hypothetical protein